MGERKLEFPNNCCRHPDACSCEEGAGGWVRSWEEIFEDRKRYAEYEAEYQAAGRRFNEGVRYVNGRYVGPASLSPMARRAGLLAERIMRGNLGVLAREKISQ